MQSCFFFLEDNKMLHDVLKIKMLNLVSLASEVV